MWINRRLDDGRAPHYGDVRVKFGGNCLVKAGVVPSLHPYVTPRAFRSELNPGEGSQVAERGAADPLWHPPQEVGRTRRWVHSQSFLSQYSFYGCNKSFTGLALLRRHLCVWHRETLVDKPLPTSPTSNFMTQCSGGQFLLRSLKNQRPQISLGYKAWYGFNELVKHFLFLCVYWWFHQKGHNCIFLFAQIWWNRKSSSPAAH